MREFEIRRDPNITTAGTGFVSPEDWNSFHNIIENDGDGLTIAVMDSGIDTTHPIWDHTGIEIEQPDIDGLPTNQNDDLGHGHAVAGCIAILASNVDTIIDVPIFGDSGRTGPKRIHKAYKWMIDRSEKLDMVNMSWGAPTDVPPINTLHNELEQNGVDAVVAAGNTDGQTGSPATADRAFAVAACTLDGKMTRWSSPTDNIAALGQDIAMPKSKDGDIGTRIDSSNFTDYMKKVGGEWVKMSGTSFACPITCGMAATFRTKYESGALLGKDVRKEFEKSFVGTAQDIKGTDEDGQGYIDYQAARQADEVDATVEADVIQLPIAGGFIDGDVVVLGDNLIDEGSYDVSIEDLRALFEE